MTLSSLRSIAAMVALAPLALTSMVSVSAAIDQAYLGEWAQSGETCDGDRTFRITKGGMSGREFACRTTRSSQSNSGWKFRMACTGEGNEYVLNLRWLLLKSGRLRETIDGKTLEYRRCSGGSEQSEAAGKNTPFGRTGTKEFARKCVACFNDAQQMGRSVGGYCPSDCVDVFSTEMVCDNQGHCRLRP